MESKSKSAKKKTARKKQSSSTSKKRTSKKNAKTKEVKDIVPQIQSVCSGIVEETQLSDREQKYLAAYLSNFGNRVKAARAANLSYDGAIGIESKANFQEALKKHSTIWIQQVLERGYRDAMNGSPDLIKFFLMAENPEKYDPQIRKLIWAKENGAEDLVRPPQFVLQVGERPIHSQTVIEDIEFEEKKNE